MKKLCLFIFVLLTVFAKAQSPTNNDVLPYIHVPLQWPAVIADYYLVTITNKQNTISKIKTYSNAVLLKEKINWNETYNWQVTAFANNKKVKEYETLQFTTTENTAASIHKAKINVSTTSKKEYSDDLIFIENIGALIDRNGKVIWNLKKADIIELDEKSYRSMQMTNDGKITFLTLNGSYETDLQGNITWQAPKQTILNPESDEQYHHHFTKTNWGTYMCASYQFVTQKHFYNNQKEVKVRYNTLIEFDKLGNYLWSWNEKDHIDQKIIFEGSNGEENEWAGTHLNGFVIDSKSGLIYMSCRNSSQVYAINFPSGNVVKTWSGKPGKFNAPPFTFYDQHGPDLDMNNNLVVYNNNINREAKGPVYPTIQLINTSVENIKKPLLWEYTCTWDKKPEGIQTKEGFAKALPNGNILICVGGTERIFEVNKNKKVVWDCTFEKSKSADTDKMVPFSNYRAYNTGYLHPTLFGINILLNKKTKKPELIIENLGNKTTFEVVIKTIDGESEIKRTKVTALEKVKTILSLDTLNISQKNYKIEVVHPTNKSVIQSIICNL